MVHRKKPTKLAKNWKKWWKIDEKTYYVNFKEDVYKYV